jgi:hypothetical protein
MGVVEDCFGGCALSGSLHRSTGSISSSVNEGTKAWFWYGFLKVEGSIAAILFAPMLDPLPAI